MRPTVNSPGGRKVLCECAVCQGCLSWFWTGVGAVAVGADVTAVLLSSGNESKLPPTNLESQGAF
jgi:hypothetical protein